ncbi:unnamed protein product [Soboliphyme baturini]|uniref:RNA-binding protein 19 n=1 Tax=Soboliphyme baturini TaxID=241478 RepID=A0A183IRT1_9BILA|nr:unnamed protein product [Soboliphyme baturini]
MPEDAIPVCSRLVVKGLPTKFTQEDVRKLFEDFGLITDCQLKFGANGVSRRFAFVGFRGDDEATAAKQHFHNSFVGASRIQVEYCRAYSAAKSDPRKSADRQKSPSLTVCIDCGQRIKKKSLHQFLAPVRPVKIVFVPQSTAVTVVLSKRSEVNNVLKLDGTFLSGKRVSVTVSDSVVGHVHGSGQKSSDEGDIDYKPETADDIRRNADIIAETGCLFVRNLPYVCTVQDLRDVFQPFGELVEVSLPIEQETQKPKGFALLKYMFPEHALKAYTALDGSVFHGRLLHILPSSEAVKLPSAVQLDDDSLKSKKKAELLETTVRGVNWNTLFLGANAVADVLADELGTAKRDILDPASKSSLGVRMALGETHVVADTRQFLLENGVDLDKFSDSDAKRSESVILVKNLPAGTDSQEIRKVFDRYGRLGRVVLPPSGISALVEFMNSQDAAKAFKAQIFKRFKSSPLFLEWAPDAVFKSQFELELEKSKADQPKAVTSTADVCDVESHHNTLFVKGLDFATSDEAFAKHFERIGPLVYATVAKKSNPAKAGELLSMGYGFVQFRKSVDASRALKELQNSTIDGRSITLKFSERAAKVSPKLAASTLSKRTGRDKGKERSESTILVRNIPFQANKREITNIFNTFGELRAVRLPRKTQSSEHRGFGFIDFVSKDDAQAAFNALCHSTHLYGRRLVLEWASVESDLDELRKRTAVYFTDAAMTAKQSRMLLEKSLK